MEGCARCSVGRLVVPTATDGTFRVRDFCSHLRQAAETFGRTNHRLLELVRGCGRAEGAALSYSAQDVEGKLMKAKRIMWADDERALHLQPPARRCGGRARSRYQWRERCHRAVFHRDGGTLGGIDMKVTAQHAGQEPAPFVAMALADSARVDWDARTGRYGKYAGTAETVSTPVSAATTEQLEDCAVRADAERRRAARARGPVVRPGRVAHAVAIAPAPLAQPPGSPAA